MLLMDSEERVLTMSAQETVFGKSSLDFCHWVRLIHGPGIFIGFFSRDNEMSQYGRNTLKYW